MEKFAKQMNALISKQFGLIFKHDGAVFPALNLGALILEVI